MSEQTNECVKCIHREQLKSIEEGNFVIVTCMGCKRCPYLQDHYKEEQADITPKFESCEFCRYYIPKLHPNQFQFLCCDDCDGKSEFKELLTEEEVFKDEIE